VPPPDAARVTPGIPFPSKISKAQAVADQWPASDIAIAAFHLKALGASEEAARLVLHNLASVGVRRVAAYVRKFTAADLAEWERRYERSHPRAEQRGDFINIRTPLRWPWRTTSGGAHYAS
jgi:hypothetical protein